jgi:hypothetical protein
MAGGGEVDDAEAIVPERNTVFFGDIDTRIVGSAVAYCFQHALKLSRAMPGSIVN